MSSRCQRNAGTSLFCRCCGRFWHRIWLWFCASLHRPQIELITRARCSIAFRSSLTNADPSIAHKSSCRSTISPIEQSNVKSLVPNALLQQHVHLPSRTSEVGSKPSSVLDEERFGPTVIPADNYRFRISRNCWGLPLHGQRSVWP